MKMELCEQSMHVLESSSEIKMEQTTHTKTVMRTPKTPHKRKMLTIAEKMEIINAIKSGASNASICKQRKLTSSSVSSIWKSRDTIIAAFECNKAKAKRLRLCDKSDLEEVLASWVREQIKQNVTITRPLIKEKAAEFAEKLGYTNYTCHNSWLDRFKIRNNITYGKKRERKNVSNEITRVWMNVDNIKIEEQGEIIDLNEEWINNSLKDESPVQQIINDKRINNNIKNEPTVGKEIENNLNPPVLQTITESLFEDKIISNEEVQCALHTLLLFYKTNDISSEFQNHLSQIKRIVDDYFIKKE